MRQSGILLHITSLPGREGIGTLGREARGFVDFLVKAGMSIWQVLPISPTGYAESPYQCFSTYAGNPLLIDLYTLKRQGILKSEALPPASDEPELIDYAPIIEYKTQMLGLAFTQSYKKLKKKVDAFRAENALWIEDFALFMAIKKHFGGISWQEWPDEAIRMRKARALREYQKELKEQIDLEVFIQYLFFEQWFALKAYANERGIRIFGDMPIYVAEDSADAWANPAVFQLDKHRRPVKIAGVPPDYFAVDGQRWGNPLYDWRYLKRTGFEWWINRLRAMARIFDITRVDHFIGFANYYAVPADEDTARNGVWVTGPGRAFFDAVKRELPGMNIVAEDLGAVSPRVRRLLDDTGYPGMKVMTFAFSGDPYNEHLPKYHEKNSLVYTGTHDNNTLLGWWANAPTHERNNALLALGIRHDEELTEAFIKATLNSVANTAIIPMQDVLRLGASARMNLPGSVRGNWQWRMKPKATSNKVAAWLYQLNDESGRLPEKDLPF